MSARFLPLPLLATLIADAQAGPSAVEVHAAGSPGVIDCMTCDGYWQTKGAIGWMFGAGLLLNPIERSRQHGPALRVRHFPAHNEMYDSGSEVDLVWVFRYAGPRRARIQVFIGGTAGLGVIRVGDAVGVGGALGVSTGVEVRATDRLRIALQLEVLYSQGPVVTDASYTKGQNMVSAALPVGMRAAWAL